MLNFRALNPWSYNCVSSDVEKWEGGGLESRKVERKEKEVKKRRRKYEGRREIK
jgi:hypothetical protein